jgi:Ankyrin repeats (many copies)/Zinc finger, ZZ type
MKKALGELPHTLPDAYVNIMQRIKAKGPSSHELALKVLSWIYHGQIPMRMDQLREALAIDDDDDELEVEDLIPVATIIDVCESLVVHDKASGVVRFTHYSVQEFLRHSVSTSLVSVVELGKTCLNCLNFKIFEEVSRGDDSSLRTNQFGQFAARAWGSYVRGAGEEEKEVVRLLLKLLKSQNKLNSMVEMYNLTNTSTIFSLSRGTTSPLHIIAMNGLATICRKVLQIQRSPVNAPRNGGESDMAEEFKFEPPLDISARDGRGWTPLSDAAFHSHVDTVKILLEMGADVSERDEFLRTPMHWATSAGNTEVIKVLLDFHAELTAEDCQGLTPFVLAMHHGRTESVVILSATRGIQLQGCNSGAQSDVSPERHLAVCLELLNVFRKQPSLLQGLATEAMLVHCLGSCYLAMRKYSDAIHFYDLAVSLQQPVNSDITEPDKVIQTNFCDNCDQEVRGYRHQCKICRDYDLCHKCFQLEPRPHFVHELITIPSPSWKPVVRAADGTWSV